MNYLNMINAKAIRRVLNFKELLPAIEKSLGAFSRGQLHPLGAIQPLRSQLRIPDQDGTLLVMPGFLPQESALVTKLVTLFPKNLENRLPAINAIIVLMSPKDGRFLALLDGESITDLRTAASSGVASKYLAPSNVKKVAVLGAGVQGASHARVHHYLYGQTELNIWSRSENSAKKLADSLRGEGILASHVTSVDEAVRDADVINTCTLSSTPVLRASCVKEGAHINAVGAPRPDWQEIDPTLMTSSVIYTDSKEAALVESGDVIHSGAEIYAEIGEVINGKKEARRQETTIYKSLGIGVLDAVSSRLAYDKLKNESSESIH